MLKKSASGVLALLDGIFEHPDFIQAPTPYGIFQPYFSYTSSFSAAS
jgi:hypothetical protein